MRYFIFCQFIAVRQYLVLMSGLHDEANIIHSSQIPVWPLQKHLVLR